MSQDAKRLAIGLSTIFLKPLAGLGSVLLV